MEHNNNTNKQFQIITGEQMDHAFLERIIEIDRAVYEEKYVGRIDRGIARFDRCPRSFVCIFDPEEDRLAGYINFFPCAEALYREIRFDGRTIRDDDIRPDEMTDWELVFIPSEDIDGDPETADYYVDIEGKTYECEVGGDDEETDDVSCDASGDEEPEIPKGNHVYILSLAIHPDYQNRNAIITLSNAFVSYLQKLEADGCHIADLLATAVSDDGKKAAYNYMFRQLRRLDDGNTVLICDGVRRDKLLEHDLYFKTYRDDIYLMLPFAEHPENHRLDELFCKKGLAQPPLVRAYMSEMAEYRCYECENAVSDEIESIYLGSRIFLHSDDDYPCDGRISDFSEETVLGEVPGHLILTAHRPTHMYILTILFTDYPFSTTQLEDQVSYEYLKIRHPEDPDKYYNFYEYLRLTWGLHECGQEKVFLYLNQKPQEQMSAGAVNKANNTAAAGMGGDTADISAAFSADEGSAAKPDEAAPANTSVLNDAADGEEHIPQEFQDMMAAEVYNSTHIDYRIDSEEVKSWCRADRSQYDDYTVYLSPKVIAYIPKEFSPDPMQRVLDAATYHFIVELVLFQNTSVAKTSRKIANALTNGGNIDLKNVLDLQNDFGRSARFWEVQNFKYPGTQEECNRIMEAFGNKEQREAAAEQQEFLEHIVEVRSAISENRNTWILNAVVMILTIIQIQPFVEELLKKLYGTVGIAAKYASYTYYYGLFGGAFCIFLIICIL